MSHLTPVVSGLSGRVLLLALLATWFSLAPCVSGEALAQEKPPAKDAAAPDKADAPEQSPVKKKRGAPPKTNWLNVGLYSAGGVVGLILLIVLVMKAQAGGKR